MTTTFTDRPVDEEILADFMGRAISDVGATISAALVVLGDRLGLYRAMADGIPITANELAERTDTAAVYLRPWLANQAAGGYVEYNASQETFSMTPEQALALAVEDGPAFLPGSMQLALGALHAVPAIEQCFRNGKGFGWHEHDADLFAGTERFFRPGYVANLVATWLPSLDGVIDTLTTGAQVADVGCGHGASTILMAAAYPSSTFLGTDYHEGSVLVARRRAQEAGVADRTQFEVHDAEELPIASFDLITMFDCLHDMGDPHAAARSVRQALKPGGTLMLVEPNAGDRLEENLHPLGRVFYGASTLVCTPCSMAQPGAEALGPQAGPARITALLHKAGFSHVRVATQSPVNLVFEARA